MAEPSPSRAVWVLALPLTPVLLGAPLVGGGLAYAANGPIALGAFCAWTLTAAATTAILAQKSGWAQAIGIVCVATALGAGGLLVLGAVGAMIIFGLVVAICGGGR